MSTQEQRADRAWFTSVVQRVMPDARVKDDGEGWPHVPGTMGRVESGADGATLWVYTDRPRLMPKLRAIPGLTAYQVGDHEARFRVDDSVTGLSRALATIRARKRRQYSPEQKMALETRLAEMRARMTR